MASTIKFNSKLLILIIFPPDKSRYWRLSILAMKWMRMILRGPLYPVSGDKLSHLAGVEPFVENLKDYLLKEEFIARRYQQDQSGNSGGSNNNMGNNMGGNSGSGSNNTQQQGGTMNNSSVSGNNNNNAANTVGNSSGSSPSQPSDLYEECARVHYYATTWLYQCLLATPASPVFNTLVKLICIHGHVQDTQGIINKGVMNPNNSFGKNTGAGNSGNSGNNASGNSSNSMDGLTGGMGGMGGNFGGAFGANSAGGGSTDPKSNYLHDTREAYEKQYKKGVVSVGLDILRILFQRDKLFIALYNSYLSKQMERAKHLAAQNSSSNTGVLQLYQGPGGGNDPNNPNNITSSQHNIMANMNPNNINSNLNQLNQNFMNQNFGNNSQNNNPQAGNFSGNQQQRKQVLPAGPIRNYPDLAQARQLDGSYLPGSVAYEDTNKQGNQNQGGNQNQNMNQQMNQGNLSQGNNIYGNNPNFQEQQQRAMRRNAQGMLVDDVVVMHESITSTQITATQVASVEELLLVDYPELLPAPEPENPNSREERNYNSRNLSSFVPLTGEEANNNI
jgi:hypothetical protein